MYESEVYLTLGYFTVLFSCHLSYRLILIHENTHFECGYSNMNGIKVLSALPILKYLTDYVTWRISFFSSDDVMWRGSEESGQE